MFRMLVIVHVRPRTGADNHQHLRNRRTGLQSPRLVLHAILRCRQNPKDRRYRLGKTPHRCLHQYQIQGDWNLQNCIISINAHVLSLQLEQVETYYLNDQIR